MNKDEWLEIGKLLWAGVWAAVILLPTAAVIARKGWSAVIAIAIFIGIVGLIVLAISTMILAIDLYYDWDYKRRQMKGKK